jgi:hypothetical protein
VQRNCRQQWSGRQGNHQRTLARRQQLSRLEPLGLARLAFRVLTRLRVGRCAVSMNGVTPIVSPPFLMAADNRWRTVACAVRVPRPGSNHVPEAISPTLTSGSTSAAMKASNGSSSSSSPPAAGSSPECAQCSVQRVACMGGGQGRQVCSRLFRSVRGMRAHNDARRQQQALTSTHGADMMQTWQARLH